MRAAALLPALALLGCSAPPSDPEAFAADPERARRVVMLCDGGDRRRDCDAARRGLAEAERRARMAGYEDVLEGRP